MTRQRLDFVRGPRGRNEPEEEAFARAIKSSAVHLCRRAISWKRRSLDASRDTIATDELIIVEPVTEAQALVRERPIQIPPRKAQFR